MAATGRFERDEGMRAQHLPTPSPALVPDLIGDDRTTQYSRALVMRPRLWNTGSPAFAGDDGFDQWSPVDAANWREPFDGCG
jgi:hypothetical protein